MSTDLIPVIYDISSEEIECIHAQYAALSAETPAGYEEVRLAIRALVGLRSRIEARRVQLKKDALDYGRNVDKKAKDLVEMIEAIELPLKAKKQVIDDVALRAKREAEEQERQAAEDARRAQEAEARAKQQAEEDRLAAAREALRLEREGLRQEEARLALIAREHAETLAKERAELDARRLETERLEQERLARLESDRQAEAARVHTEEARIAELERQARVTRLLPALEKLRIFTSEMRPWVSRLQLPAEINHRLTVLTDDYLTLVAALMAAVENGEVV